MKKCKKLLSLVLAICLIAGCCSSGAYALNVNDDCIPSIVIPGIFQSETFYYEDGKIATDLEGNPYKAPFYLDTTAEIAGAALTKALVPLASMLINQEDKEQQAANALADVLGDVLLEKSRCDENGQFVHDIRATKYNASFAELSEHDQEHIMDQLPLQIYVDLAGAENLYVFSYASLGNMISTANELFDFIQFVKEDSGSEKVNIVPISQGGSLANALLELYAEKDISVARDIDRIVYVVPALDGSTLIGEIYEYGLLDDSYELYNTMLPSLMGEDEIVSYLVNIVLRIMPNADLNNILDIAIDTLITDYLRFSTLLWGLCPSGNYPGAREKYLTDDATKNIAEQTDWFYKAQLNSDANILQAVEDGVEVFDIVDYNCSLYQLVDSWDKVNADGVIQLDSTSMGAYSLGVDKKLPADYVPTHSNCNDPSHDHTDPNGIVDVCTGLLPDTTFYFVNQNHERTGSNDVIMKLVSNLLVDDSFTSVFSYPDKFPQFNQARNSKGLMHDVEEMRDFDTSTLSDRDAQRLADAIAEVDAELDNTVVDTHRFEAVKRNFYAVRDDVLSADEEPVEKENGAYMDFSYVLKDLIELLSKYLYIIFGGAGFGEM